MQRICHRTRCDSCQRELQGVEPCCFLRGSRCKRCLCGSTTCDLQVLHGQDMEELLYGPPARAQATAAPHGHAAGPVLCLHCEVLTEFLWFACSGAFLGHLGEYLEIKFQSMSDVPQRTALQDACVVATSVHAEISGVVRLLSHGDALGAASLGMVCVRRPPYCG